MQAAPHDASRACRKDEGRCGLQAPASRSIFARRGAAGERTQSAVYSTAAPSPMTSSAPAWVFLANGKAGSDRLRPHEDLLAEFPFFGPPDL